MVNLKSIKENTVMQVVNETRDFAYRVLYSGVCTDKSFYVKSKELYEDVKGLKDNCRFRIGFFSGNSIYSFTGLAEKVMIRGGAYLTLLRQTSDIVETTQRKSKREELAVNVVLYRLSEESFEANKLERDLGKMELKSISFDISAGGLCVVCNDRLRSSTEPYYLIDFSIGKEAFLIPARLARQGNAPQMVNYRHDYGFQFMYKNLPTEERRLANALVSAKISAAIG